MEGEREKLLVYRMSLCSERKMSRGRFASISDHTARDGATGTDKIAALQRQHRHFPERALKTLAHGIAIGGCHGSKRATVVNGGS